MIFGTLDPCRSRISLDQPSQQSSSIWYYYRKVLGVCCFAVFFFVFSRKNKCWTISGVLVSTKIRNRYKETNTLTFSYHQGLKWTLLCRGGRFPDTEIIQPGSFCQFNYFLLGLLPTKPSQIDSLGDDVLCYLWNRYSPRSRNTFRSDLFSFQS